MAASAMARRRSRDSQHQQRRLRPMSTTSAGRTSDYDSEDSETLSAAAVDQPDNVSGQYRRPAPNQRQTGVRVHRTESISIDQPQALGGSSNPGPLLSPSAIDANQPQTSTDDLQASIGKSSHQSIIIDTEWPTIFRPKSSSGDPSPIPLSAATLKHQQVNPGVVPSPDRSGPASRRHKPITPTDKVSVPESHDEKRRGSLDEKLKLILQDPSSSKADADKLSPGVEEPTDNVSANSTATRHNHLPPLNVDLSSSNISVPLTRKISGDDKTSGTVIGDKTDKTESSLSASGGLPRLNSGQAGSAQTAANGAGDSVSLIKTAVISDENRSAMTVGQRPLPNLPHSG